MGRCSGILHGRRGSRRGVRGYGVTGWEERGRRRLASLSVRAVEAEEKEMGRAWFDYFELEAARQAS